MATIETRIENSYDAYQNYYRGDEAIHQLSDRALTQVVWKVNGAQYDWEIWLSTDNGNTWSLNLSMFTSGFTIFSDWVGDSLYVTHWTDVDNDPLTFYRFDYNPGSQTFSAAVSAAEVAAAESSTNYAYAACDVEPGGRVWCAYRIGGDTINAAFSDDGGSTWTRSTGLNDTSGGVTGKIGCHCLEGNTIVFWNNYTGSSQTLSFKSRLHTDSNNSWSSIDAIFGFGDEAATQGLFRTCPNSLSPSKRIFILKLEQGNSGGNRFQWAVFTEGASPFNLSHYIGPSTGSFAAPSGQDTGLKASGRQDGFVAMYVHSGSKDTLRRRLIANADTTWPSELTHTFPFTLTYEFAWSASDQVDFPLIDDAYLVGFMEGWGTGVRPWFLGQNITTAVDFISDLPFEFQADVNLTADLLVESLSELDFTADLLAETLADLLWIGDIPVEWFGLWFSIVDSWNVLQYLSEPFLDEWRVVPTALDDISFQDSWNVRGLLGADFPDSWRVLPQELVTLFNSDIQLPKATVDKS